SNDWRNALPASIPRRFEWRGSEILYTELACALHETHRAGWQVPNGGAAARITSRVEPADQDNLPEAESLRAYAARRHPWCELILRDLTYDPRAAHVNLFRLAVVKLANQPDRLPPRQHQIAPYQNPRFETWLSYAGGCFRGR